MGDDEEFHSLSAHILSPEVKQAVDGMAPYKAPRPDRLQAVFYQKSWNTVGQNVVDFFSRSFCFATGVILEGMNCTLITLIPKVEAALLLSPALSNEDDFSCHKQSNPKVLGSVGGAGETENAIYEGKFALTKQLYLLNAKFGSDIE
ncbi:hypothetical protein Ddye_021675 [Dipteronia dyeriana]|uniref:Uncharacterized protein n=1 Tax=Dipteronia dyeriana TaxID=168575 RepID=A0AAD9U336_9ROSI|nr:hypothetical protein Ddye_021675 [Dipteronia dyeriana]